MAATPDGSPVGVPIPVAPDVVCVKGGKEVLTHKTGDPEAALTDWVVVTLMVPVAVAVPHPPTIGTE